MLDSTTFAVVYDAFWKRTGIHEQEFVWLYDGDRIHRSLTPREYEMQTGDVLHLMLPQLG